jgi:hypothetical protein
MDNSEIFYCEVLQMAFTEDQEKEIIDFIKEGKEQWKKMNEKKEDKKEKEEEKEDKTEDKKPQTVPKPQPPKTNSEIHKPEERQPEKESLLKKIAKAIW